MYAIMSNNFYYSDERLLSLALLLNLEVSNSNSLFKVESQIAP